MTIYKYIKVYLEFASALKMAWHILYSIQVYEIVIHDIGQKNVNLLNTYYYNTLPLSSLLDSVFRSKMKSKAELRIMLYFFFMLHSLFVILSFSPPILFTKKKICNKKENNFLSHVVQQLPHCALPPTRWQTNYKYIVCMYTLFFVHGTFSALTFIYNSNISRQTHSVWFLPILPSFGTGALIMAHFL